MAVSRKCHGFPRCKRRGRRIDTADDDRVQCGKHGEILGKNDASALPPEPPVEIRLGDIRPIAGKMNDNAQRPRLENRSVSETPGTRLSRRGNRR
jgi:hypothetical protein